MFKFVMRHKAIASLSALLVVGVLGVFLIAVQVLSGEDEKSTSVKAETKNAYAGKKVLFVNSYHAGYEWSDGIEAGLHTGFDNSGVEFKVVYLDTKRNPGEEFAVKAGEAAKAEIDTFKPDVVIAADDNAQKYLVVPYLMESDIPVVFCGVNWDATLYGYPNEHITGMVEVELVQELINHLKEYAEGERVGYVTVASETESKVIKEYNQRFFDGQMKAYEVKTLEEFEQAFLTAQDEVDIVFIGNNAGTDWDIEAATQFFNENTRIPTGAINSWMAPYSMITLAKLPEEQGEWSAQAALSILDGTPVTQIAVVENKQGKLILNLDIAEKLGVVFSPTMLRNAELYTTD